MTTLRDPELCPRCQWDGEVIDSRKRKGYRRRVHRCLNRNCRHQWKSYQTTLNPRYIREAWNHATS